jgi:hypothetical protein
LSRANSNQFRKEMNMSDKALQVIESKNVEVGEWGLNFKNQLTVEEWFNTVIALQKVDGKIQWYLGDLAVYAESITTGWGESKYKDLVKATGYDEGTLRVMANVARRFPSEFRANVLSRDNAFERLSFHHFRAVAPLDDSYANYWLTKAAEGGWGVARLRDEIRGWANKELPSNDEDEKPLTFAQRVKEAFTIASEVMKAQGAETIRIQVVKNGKVIDEQLVDVETS